MFPKGTFKTIKKAQNRDLFQNDQWPNLKNLSGGLNLSRSLNMVGST